MIKSIDVARALFEEHYPCGTDPARDAKTGKYIDLSVQRDWTMFMMGFDHAWCASRPAGYEDSEGNYRWDLDQSAWETIKDAAANSNWIPPEYSANYWHADVVSFLKEH